MVERLTLVVLLLIAACVGTIVGIWGCLAWGCG